MPDGAASGRPTTAAEPPAPSYFAHLDTYERTAQSRVSCWHRVRRGRRAGLVEPWPPGRDGFGRLYVRDLPP